MIFRKKALPMLVQALCLGFLPFSISHAEETQASVQQLQNYQIAANDLGYVLSSFAAQSGVVFSFDRELLKGQRSEGLQGQYTVTQGFAKILQNQPYHVIKQNNTYLLIVKDTAHAAAIQKQQSSQDLVTVAARFEDVPVQLPVLVVKAEPILSTTSKAREELQQFRGTANGDAFAGIASVQLNSLRNEAGAIDVGIRGLQGEGRVPVIIDGSLQATHTHRGYQGESDRTYIDMDLISQLSVEKGASNNRYATGAIGGTVQMKTLSVNDILLEHKNVGVLLKGTLYNNNQTPNIPENTREQDRYLLTNHLSSSKFNNGAFTTAFAYRNDLLDLVAAYSQRKVGNYFAGTQGKENYRQESAVVSPGQEVVNTSYQSKSGIIKLGWNITDEQRLELNFRRHLQQAGEVLAAYWYKAPTYDPNYPDYWTPPADRDSMAQWSLGNANVNAYSAEYHYKPNNYGLIDLNINIAKTDAKMHQHNGLWTNWGSLADQYRASYRDERTAIQISNKSRFSTLPIVLEYGLSADEQRMQPRYFYEFDSARNAKRQSQAAFLTTNLATKIADFALSTRLHESKTTDYIGERTLDYKAHVDVLTHAAFHLNDQVDLYGKLGNSYRNPSLFESTESRETFNYYPHNPIRAENSRHAELGLQGQYADLFTAKDKLNVSLNYFYNNIKDYLSQGAIPPGPDSGWWETYLLAFKNYDKVVLKGTELNANYQHPAFSIEANATFNATAKICPVKNQCNAVGDAWSLISTRIAPKRTINLTLAKNFLDQDLSIGTRVRYHSEKHNPRGWFAGTAITGRAVEDIPADTLIDLFARYKLNQHANLNVSIENLTNRYAFDPGTVIGMPTPGRTVQASLELRF
ncbi:MAG: TonB-dependent receptor [Acinetobacter populi]|jgi:hemoglobin/transferrin/lactoferrin receptor protein|uniref:TonB-dependent receptor n=1 Tax=Acinetobacter populi TaxID=1582270 RepID=UPI002352A8AD|nr:TonB-dependent receptor [Acinetobacter populi]MCH4246488.1 TonB-dependent receptor [Acinetobacter populi]